MKERQIDYKLVNLVLFILIIYLISSILNSNFAINLVSLIMIGIGLVGGVLGRYNWSKYKVV